MIAKRARDIMAGGAGIDIDGLSVRDHFGHGGGDPLLGLGMALQASGEGALGLDLGDPHCAVGVHDRARGLQHTQLAPHRLLGHRQRLGQFADTVEPAIGKIRHDFVLAALAFHHVWQVLFMGSC